MGQIGQSADPGEAERKQVVMRTLATLGSQGENLAEVAHDARNMVTALGLYCDLLEEPGVLTAPFMHYGSELRLVAAASRRLVERLADLHAYEDSGAARPQGALRELDQLPAKTGTQTGARRDANPGQPRRWDRHWDLMPSAPIGNLAEELQANRNLLAALAGTAIVLTVDAKGGALPVRLTGEDLTRILVNLVKNAAEAMPAGGKVQLSLRERPPKPDSIPGSKPDSKPDSKPGSKPGSILGAVQWLALTIEDDGPGIPPMQLEKIFEAGYTSRAHGGSLDEGWPVARHGLGLSITRSMIEAAGGRIQARNCTPTGASFRIELPVDLPDDQPVLTL
jgi:signal transduction histidine kinase